MAKEKTEAELILLRDLIAERISYAMGISVLYKMMRKSEAERKPLLSKIASLRRGIRYIDKVAIPESLKKLSVSVHPAFSLSEWVQKALEERKRKAKR